ncbi:MAG: flavin-dependent monooxygenase [Novosphingobium sp.]|nr:flavin-dependent monooxygenase [Novosphingobium sp.]
MDTLTADIATSSAFRAAALDELFAVLPSQAGRIAQDHRLPSAIVDLLKRAGVYRMMVARRFGGDEATPTEFLNLIERIAAVDASTGWVASFGFSAIYLGSLPVATLETMYANGPDVVFAGGIFPPQRAVPVDGGLQVNGRWSWGSGCTGADIMGVGIKVDNSDPTGGLPLIAVMPAASVRIEENWNVNGLQGTGSHDMVVEDVVVPREWTFVRGGPSSLDGPLYRYPSMALAAQVLAIVALGAARGALDDIVAMASGRTSITGSPSLANRPTVQMAVAQGEASLRAARALFYQETERTYAALCEGRAITREEVVALRLAASHAARTGADVCMEVYKCAGTTGIFTDSTIGRRLQDALIVPQHAFLSDSTLLNAGRCLLGLDAPAGFP